MPGAALHTYKPSASQQTGLSWQGYGDVGLCVLVTGKTCPAAWPNSAMVSPGNSDAMAGDICTASVMT